jgi:hypothetical protein
MSGISPIVEEIGQAPAVNPAGQMDLGQLRHKLPGTIDIGTEVELYKHERFLLPSSISPGRLRGSVH